MYVGEQDDMADTSGPTFQEVILRAWKLDGYIAPRVKWRYLAFIWNSMKPFVRK